MRKTALLFLVCINIMFLQAQNEDANPPLDTQPNKLYFGIETGILGIDSSELDYDFIREDAVHYYDDFYNEYSGISMVAYMPFVSLKVEYRTKSDKFWISTGIKYAALTSKMGPSNHSDYFYVMLKQNNDETYYYRINEVQERNHYIGVPIDIRFSPFKPRFFRPFFKFGIDVNFKIASKQSIDFYDPEMKKYENDILNLFDQPNSIYAAGTFGAGIQLGRANKPNVRIEADIPSFFITEKAFGLFDHNVGIGGRISFVLPLNIK